MSEKIEVRFMFSSGVSETVLMTADEGASAGEAAESCARNIGKLEWLANQDEETGDWFFVNMKNIAFVRARPA